MCSLNTKESHLKSKKVTEKNLQTLVTKQHTSNLWIQEVITRELKKHKKY